MPAVAKGDVDFTAKTFVGYARKFDGVLSFVIVGNDVPEQPVAVETIETDNSIYVADGIIVVPNAVMVEVYDINGRVVASVNFEQVNISDLNKGIYIVRSFCMYSLLHGCDVSSSLYVNILRHIS